MKEDPMLGTRFAHVVLEELAMLRAELVCQRSIHIELLSRLSRESRRKIKLRLYLKNNLAPHLIAKDLKARVGLEGRSP
jgi:hypothetical protein